IKVAENSHYRLKVRGFDKKRVLIKMLTSNFFIDGCNVQISLKKSLETIVNFKGCPTWLEITRSYRAENPEEFTSLGRVCEIFLKNM
nr:hypothetical protein [Candidatus Enterousia merdequi]